MPVALPDPNLLVLDDEPANVGLLQAILQQAGYRRVKGLTDPAEALRVAAASPPDLVLLDLHMPLLDGYEVLRRLRSGQPDGSFLPIIVLTADITQKARERALAGGATDFVTKPFDNTEVLQRCRNLLATRALHLALQDQKTRLEETVRQRTRALEQTLEELRATQTRQVEQERMRALGELSGGIAADFNNQLTAMLGYSDLLLLNDARMLGNQALTRRYVENIRVAARASSTIVGRLREFSRPRTAGDPLLPLNLAKLVQETATLTQPRWRAQARAAGSTVTVQLDLQPTADVPGNAAELREVVMQLIFNAVDAMPRGGNIVLRTRHTEAGRVCLEVTDSGIGMSEETRRRCLEPFFTTKNEAGKGMGLSMVYGVIQRHDGELDIRTTPGDGTTVSIRLPALTTEANGSSTPVPPTTRSLRVLLVEDDPVAREVVCAYLHRDDHEVTTAVTGREGLAKFMEGPFDLVVTDMAIAELNGEGLAAAIRERNPAMPIILLTGFADWVDDARLFDVVLHKPIIVGELWQAIARVTAQAPAGADREAMAVGAPSPLTA